MKKKMMKNSDMKADKTMMKKEVSKAAKKDKDQDMKMIKDYVKNKK